MDKKQFVASLCAILGTLADCPEGCPESTLYIAVGMDMSVWSPIRNALVTDGFITVARNHWVTPTPKGIDAGKRLNAALDAAKNN